MGGNVSRYGRRRTGPFLLAVIAVAAVGLAILLGSVSSAIAKTVAAPQGHTPVAVVHTSPPAVVLKAPPPVAHAAGHKIA